jgi:para-nitrobenzyl esterase
VYRYLYTHRREEGPLALVRAAHTLEIPFVFHNLEASPWTRGVAGAAALADQVSDAWLAFAQSGDPNTHRVPRWPAFDAQRRATMVFDSASAVADDPLREQRLAMFAAKGLGT